MEAQPEIPIIDHFGFAFYRCITVTKSRTVAWMSPHNFAGTPVSWLLDFPTLLDLSSPDCCSNLFNKDRNLNRPVAGTLSAYPVADSAKLPISSDNLSRFVLLRSALVASIELSNFMEIPKSSSLSLISELLHPDPPEAGS